MKQPLLALTEYTVNITVQRDSQGQKSHQCPGPLPGLQPLAKPLLCSAHLWKPHISIFLEQYPLGNTSCMRENKVFNTSSTRSGYIITGMTLPAEYSNQQFQQTEPKLQTFQPLTALLLEITAMYCLQRP